ncbi:MAG: hypothetical protein QTN59_01435 [Candidatus Electrothrix communis]|nr:MAG: hypothetical protein QTN59_01435 [Candidatus Electrothrix communis]
MKSSENVSCQDTTSNRIDKHVCSGLSDLLVVILLFLYLFTNSSNNNDRIALTGQMACCLQVGTYISPADNVQSHPDTPSAHSNPDATALLAVFSVIPDRFPCAAQFPEETFSVLAVRVDNISTSSTRFRTYRRATSSTA